MISNTLLKLASGGVLLVVVGTIAVDLLNQDSSTTGPIESRIGDGAFASSPSAFPTEPTKDSEGSELASTNTASLLQTPGTGERLTIGVIGATPSQNEIVTISEIPWLTSQVNRSFRDAEDSSCTLLVPDLAIEPSLANAQPGRRRSLGRIPAFTVGLEIDESAKRALPVATKGAIQNYLKEHRLAIEPTVYVNEEGKLYFGTDCRAAFYKNSNPTRSVQSEPMIDEAIGKFRALGVLGGDLANTGRTLLMAFRYVKSGSKISSITSVQETETELLFLHLDANATPKKLSFNAFVTSDERQKLHELAIGSAILRQSVPTIVATIRFDSFVMMGMYPAEPVVTGVRHQASGVLPVTSIRLLNGQKLPENRLSFEEVLDQFGELSRGANAIR